MKYDPLLHVQIKRADFVLKCCGDDCENECEGSVDCGQSSVPENLGESIELIEQENGWSEGLCFCCVSQAKFETLYEKAHMLNKLNREEVAQ